MRVLKNSFLGSLVLPGMLKRGENQLRALIGEPIATSTAALTSKLQCSHFRLLECHAYPPR